MMLYQYIKEWRKNPQWSFSCCLAFLLPLSDLQGEISGLAETNALNSQLQTGEAEIPTLSGALKDRGAIDVTFEGGEQDVNDERRKTYKMSSRNTNKIVWVFSR